MESNETLFDPRKRRRNEKFPKTKRSRKQCIEGRNLYPTDIVHGYCLSRRGK